MSSAPTAILFCSTTEGLWGGSEVLWSQAAGPLLQSGVRVAAFFPYYKDIEPIRRLEAAGVRIFFGSPRPTRWWRRIGRPALDRRAHFENCLREFQPNLVICNQGAVRDGAMEFAACHAHALAYTIITQAVEPLHYDDATWRRLRADFGGARRIWCVSTENLSDLRHYLADPLAHAEVIPNSYACGFDVDCPWPADHAVSRLAVVARLEPEQKAQDVVLKVLARERWQTRPLQVTFFGDGPARARLESQAVQFGLRNVSFAGSAGVTAIWRDQHALLLPSRYEGQSLAMIEAMLHSRAVITTPVGGTAGVVIEGRTGYLASACGDVAALDEVMERAWLDRERWPAVGRNGRARIREFIWRDPGAEFARRILALNPQP